MDKRERLLQSSWDLLNKMTALDKFRMKDRLKDYTSSEVHCIEFIGNNVDPNVTRLAQAFFMTRGAISKMTKKLVAKGLIESYQGADNLKEVYFRLTRQGKAVYKLHDQLHREFQERDKAVFKQIPAKELEAMLGFIEKYRAHIDEEIRKLGESITTGTAFD